MIEKVLRDLNPAKVAYYYKTIFGKAKLAISAAATFVNIDGDGNFVDATYVDMAEEISFILMSGDMIVFAFTAKDGIIISSYANQECSWYYSECEDEDGESDSTDDRINFDDYFKLDISSSITGIVATRSPVNLNDLDDMIRALDDELVLFRLNSNRMFVFSTELSYGDKVLVANLVIYEDKILWSSSEEFYQPFYAHSKLLTRYSPSVEDVILVFKSGTKITAILDYSELKFMTGDTIAFELVNENIVPNRRTNFHPHAFLSWELEEKHDFIVSTLPPLVEYEITKIISSNSCALADVLGEPKNSLAITAYRKHKILDFMSKQGSGFEEILALLNNCAQPQYAFGNQESFKTLEKLLINPTVDYSYLESRGVLWHMNVLKNGGLHLIVPLDSSAIQTLVPFIRYNGFIDGDNMFSSPLPNFDS